VTRARVNGSLSNHGRLGGGRQKPIPPKKVMEPRDRVARVDLDGETEPMSAREVRLFIEHAVTLGVAGKLDKDLARLAVQATSPWLAAIAMDDQIAQMKAELARINKLLGLGGDADDRPDADGDDDQEGDDDD
jgi:hypothetical protein